MKQNDSGFRGWEYAKLGDYHRNLDPNWSYTPTYLRKMDFIKKFFDSIPKETRILDAGCGEGLLVEEYRNRGYSIEGLDLNYESEFVRLGNILEMPYPDNSFDVITMLDVFEHLHFEDQPKALAEIKRVLIPEGTLLISIPNQAHLNSRFRFILRGRIDRTDVETNHPGERPYKENLKILKNAGLDITNVKGITLTVPYLYRGMICRRPAKYKWLHDTLEMFCVPSLSMLNIFTCKTRNTPGG